MKKISISFFCAFLGLCLFAQELTESAIETDAERIARVKSEIKAQNEFYSSLEKMSVPERTAAMLAFRNAEESKRTLKDAQHLKKSAFEENAEALAYTKESLEKLVVSMEKHQLKNVSLKTAAISLDEPEDTAVKLEETSEDALQTEISELQLKRVKAELASMSSFEEWRGFSENWDASADGKRMRELDAEFAALEARKASKYLAAEKIKLSERLNSKSLSAEDKNIISCKLQITKQRILDLEFNALPESQKASAFEAYQKNREEFSEKIKSFSQQ